MKKMKLLLTLVCFVVAMGFFSIPTEAKTYQYGYLKYELTSDQDHFRITGCDSDITDVQIPATIDGSEVTEIGEDAFYNNSSIKTVTMPNVKYISSWAFGNCTSLEKVSAPKLESVDVSAFFNCSSLTIVNIGQNATNKINSYIGSGVFWGCENLKTINTGNIAQIYDNAFNGCNNITTVSMPNVETVPSFQNSNIETLSAGNATYITGETFYNCKNLTSVYIPNCERIGYRAFFNCEKLTSISIPKVTYIGEEAFVNTGFKYIILSDNLTNIGTHGLGYNYTQDKYERDVWTKISGFKIHCKKGTSGYGYATGYGFAFEDHTFQVTSSVAATCTKEGKTNYACSKCGAKQITTTKALGHSYNAGVITKKRTNTKNGVRTYTCKRCHGKKNVSIPSYKSLATKAYKTKINSMYGSFNYRIVDVDNNGIPELLIKDYDNWKTRAYTYNAKKNKIVSLKSSSYGKGGSIGYNKAKHLISVMTADTGGSRTTIYQLKGLKLKKKSKIVYANGKFEKYGYKINGKRVSTAKYKKYVKGFKTIW